MTDGPTRNVVVFCIDGPYVLPCAFLIDQLARDPAAGRYDVAVIHQPIGADAETALRERPGRPVRTIAFDRDLADALYEPQAGHVSRSTYMRLFLDEQLPAQYERILYLDCDIHLDRTELAPLFDLDLGGAALAAVEDAALLVEMTRPEVLADSPRAWRGPDGVRRYRTGLGLDEHAAYFNSGVMLIDRRRWRALDLGRRANAFVEARPDRCLFADQSALNAVAAGHWVALSPRYNFQPLHQWGRLDALLRPVIRHFCGPVKPWNSDRWGRRLTASYGTWLAASGLPGTFPPDTDETPPAPGAEPRRRSASRLLSLLRRASGSRPAAAVPERPTREALASALVAGFGEGAFIDLDQHARQAFRDAVAQFRDTRSEARLGRAGTRLYDSPGRRGRRHHGKGTE